MKYKIILQKEITKQVVVPEVRGTTNLFFELRDTRNWRDIVSSLKDYKPELKPIMFCSIQVAKYVQKYIPELDVGLILTNNSPEPQIGMNSIFDWNVYTTYIPKDYMLNPKCGGTMMTFAEAMDYFRDLPKQVFIRPNSGWKSFTGFSCSRNDLRQELNALLQTEHVDPSEIVVLFKEQKIEQEYRYWIIDSQISTASSYSWNDEHKFHKPEKEVDKFVKDVVVYLDNIGKTDFVIDVAILEDGSIKVVELNAISTSGWYDAMDYEKLIYDVTMIYGGM